MYLPRTPWGLTSFGIVAKKNEELQEPAGLVWKVGRRCKKGLLHEAEEVIKARIGNFDRVRDVTDDGAGLLLQKVSQSLFFLVVTIIFCDILLGFEYIVMNI